MRKPFVVDSGFVAGDFFSVEHSGGKRNADFAGASRMFRNRLSSLSLTRGKPIPTVESSSHCVSQRCVPTPANTTAPSAAVWQ